MTPAARELRLFRLRTTFLGLSQNELSARMGLQDSLLREEVSLFERGRREPPLQFLLEYSRAANVYLEVLADDELDLPERLPGAKKSEGRKRVPAPRGKRR